MKYTYTIATGLLYAITSSWALADGHATHKMTDEKAEKVAHGHTEKHEKHEEEEFEQHGTHEHGKARLMVAKTDSGLDMMLESASFNFIGFGHKPTTEADKATFAKAKSTLETGEQIFIINKQAECTLASAEMTSTAFKDDHHDEHKKDHDKHDDKDHDEHDHDEHKKDHGKHDDKDHDEHDHKSKTHSNIDANWSFTCKNPQKADAIEVKLFTAFPDNLEQLNIEWITDTSASVSKLTQDGVINLKP